MSVDQTMNRILNAMNDIEKRKNKIKFLKKDIQGLKEKHESLHKKTFYNYLSKGIERLSNEMNLNLARRKLIEQENNLRLILIDYYELTKDLMKVYPVQKMLLTIKERQESEEQYLGAAERLRHNDEG